MVNAIACTIEFYKIFKTVRAFSLVDRCDVTLSVFSRHNLKPFQSC